MLKIAVSGLVNIETTVAVRRFPIDYYPVDYPFFGVNSNVSGVGYNVAKALTALGDSVDLFSFIGGDEEGERVLRRMERDGIDSSNVVRSLKNTPASAVLFDPQGTRMIYSDLKDIQQQSIDYDTAAAAMSGCDAAVLCNIEFNRGLIKQAGKHGVLTATDVHVLDSIDNEYNRDFMEHADILFMSDEMLPCAPEDFIRQVYDRFNNKIIVIGMGSKGAMMLDGESGEVYTVPAYSTDNIVNTIGAGDSLFSSFLHFYLTLSDPLAALRRAVIFAGVKIGFNGASVGFVSEEQIEELYSGLYPREDMRSGDEEQ